MHRGDWTQGEPARNLATLLTDKGMRDRLAATSAHMQARHGPARAAELFDNLARGAS